MRRTALLYPRSVLEIAMGKRRCFDVRAAFQAGGDCENASGQSWSFWRGQHRGVSGQGAYHVRDVESGFCAAAGP
jgi:hypothetical protein